MKFSSSFNYVLGVNGSGKSNLLEAIGLFGLGRSFRASGWRQMLQHEQAFYRLEALCQCDGVEQRGLIYRDQSMRQQQLYFDDERVGSSIAFVDHFPIQDIHPESGQLLIDGPSERRRYLDWGAFHVKRDLFAQAWRRYNQALQQRNHLIKFNEKKKRVVFI
ncbi:hypothetical protein BGC07_09130 [Piscirickettsia litoralis]|uniref:DNA replication and repair protein RecF n=1 Tax=Piscirickettsia litoralis TaxID=1891921 RepID=A0ABX3AA97_9GAMM|nr:hypothetical protein BGC07_09130 [Piscirickettsia litoralis]